MFLSWQKSCFKQVHIDTKTSTFPLTIVPRYITLVLSKHQKRLYNHMNKIYIGFIPGFGGVRVAHLFSLLCCTFCFVFLRPVFCVPNVASVSGLSIRDRPFYLVFSNVYLSVNKYTTYKISYIIYIIFHYYEYVISWFVSLLLNLSFYETGLTSPLFFYWCVCEWSSYIRVLGVSF